MRKANLDIVDATILCALEINDLRASIVRLDALRRSNLQRVASFIAESDTDCSR